MHLKMGGDDLRTFNVATDKYLTSSAGAQELMVGIFSTTLWTDIAILMRPLQNTSG